MAQHNQKMARHNIFFLIQWRYRLKIEEESTLKYSQPSAMLLSLMSEDIITASFNQTEIIAGDYTENKDTISFEDLIG